MLYLLSNLQKNIQFKSKRWTGKHGTINAKDTWHTAEHG